MPTRRPSLDAQPAGERVGGRPGRRLLLVEDHAMVREGLRRVLESSAHDPWQVDEVGTAEQALARLDREDFDLLVTDLSMPGIGGLELLLRLQHRPAAPPALVLSMYDDASHVRKAFEAGARGYVFKGSRSGDLLDAVERVAAGGTCVPAVHPPVLLPVLPPAAAPGESPTTPRPAQAAAAMDTPGAGETVVPQACQPRR